MNMTIPYAIKDVNYYYITDERMSMDFPTQALTAIEAGVKMIQYRRKTGTKDFFTDALEVREVCQGRAIFVMNDRVDMALEVDADGVHVGQDDTSFREVRELIGDKILGVSTHNMEQAAEAAEVADYIGVGPVHATATKRDIWPELGVEGALNIAGSVEIPTAAIGGIGEEDMTLLSRGFDMICSLSSVTQKGIFSEQLRTFEEGFKKAKEGFPRPN